MLSSAPHHYVGYTLVSTYGHYNLHSYGGMPIENLTNYKVDSKIPQK